MSRSSAEGKEAKSLSTPEVNIIGMFDDEGYQVNFSFNTSREVQGIIKYEGRSMQVINFASLSVKSLNQDLAIARLITEWNKLSLIPTPPITTLNEMAPYIIYFADQGHEEARNIIKKEPGVYFNAVSSFNKQVKLDEWELETLLDKAANLKGREQNHAIEMFTTKLLELESDNIGFQTFYAKVKTKKNQQRTNFEKMNQKMVDVFSAMVLSNIDPAALKHTLSQSEGGTPLALLIDIHDTTKPVALTKKTSSRKSVDKLKSLAEAKLKALEISAPGVGMEMRERAAAVKEAYCADPSSTSSPTEPSASSSSVSHSSTVRPKR